MICVASGFSSTFPASRRRASAFSGIGWVTKILGAEALIVLNALLGNGVMECWSNDNQSLVLQYCITPIPNGPPAPNDAVPRAIQQTPQERSPRLSLLHSCE